MGSSSGLQHFRSVAKGHNLIHEKLSSPTAHLGDAESMAAKKREGLLTDGGVDVANVGLVVRAGMQAMSLAPRIHVSFGVKLVHNIPHSREGNGSSQLAGVLSFVHVLPKVACVVVDNDKKIIVGRSNTAKEMISLAQAFGAIELVQVEDVSARSASKEPAS